MLSQDEEVIVVEKFDAEDRVSAFKDGFEEEFLLFQ